MKQEQDYFERFQSLCIKILSQSDNCQESQDLFRAAKSVPELVSAWQRFWAGVLHEVPEQVIKAFADLYPVYRDDIIRAGVYYNEAPVDLDGRLLMTGGMVLIGDAAEGDSVDHPLVIPGRHRIYVLGDLPLTVTDNCSVNVNADRACVTVKGFVRCNLEKGKVIAREHAVVNGHGVIVCYDATNIAISGGYVTDHGHMQITAYNDACVQSFTNRYITLNDHSTLKYLPKP